MSRRKKLFPRLFILTALLLCIALLVRSTVHYALSALLATIFTKGTQCDVSFDPPQLSFLARAGEARNIRIKHPSEGPEGGFYADRLAVRIELLPLLKKEVRLSALTVDGAHGKSLGKETGFLNLIRFIAEPPRKKPPAWHDFISTGWKVKVSDVHITRSASLDLQVGKFLLSLQDGEVHFEEPSPSEPFNVRGAAGALFLDGIPLGSATVDGALPKGKFLLREGKVERAEHDASLSAQGEIHFPDEGQYALRFSGNILSAGLANAFPAQAKFFEQREFTAAFNGEVFGVLTSPRIRSEVTLDSPNGIALVGGKGCSIRKGTFSAEVGEEALTITNLNFDDWLAGEKLSLAFTEKKPFEFLIQTKPIFPDEFLQRCIPEVTGLIAERQLAPAILRSRLEGTDISLSGKGDLASKSGEVKLRSNIVYRPELLRTVAPAMTPTSTSYSTATATFSPEKIDVKVQEYAHRAEDDDGNGESRRRKQRANIELSYSTAEQELDIKQIQLNEYPGRTLLLLVGSHLPEAVSQSIGSAVLFDTSLSGSVNAINVPVGSLLGRKIHPSGNYAFTATNLLVGGATVDSIFIGGKLTNEALVLDQGTIQAGDGIIHGAGRVNWTSALHFEATAQSIGTERTFLREYIPGLRGLLNGNATVSGSVLKPQLVVNLEVTPAGYGALQPPVPSTLQIRTTDAGVTADLSLFGGLTGHAVYPFNGKSETISLNLQASDLPIEYVLSPNFADGEILDADDIWRGRLNGEFNYKASKTDLLSGTGTLHIGSVDLRRANVRIVNTAPVDWKIDRGTISFGETSLGFDKHVVVLKGTLDRTKGWNASVNGEWELAPFAQNVPSLEQLSGTATIDTRIVGALKAPELNGTLSVREAALSLPLAGKVIGASSIELEANFDKSQLAITKLSASVEGGDLTGQGAISPLFPASERHAVLQLALRDSSLQPAEGAAVTLSGDLVMEKIGENPPTLKGDIEIVDGIYENRISILDIVRRMSDYLRGLAPRERGTSRSARDRLKERSATQFNVNVKTRDAFVIDTSVLQSELQAAVVLGGNSESPRFGGSVETITGEFGLGSTRFSILEGRVEFNPQSRRIDPGLQILAETSVQTESGDVLIQVLVRGTMLRPEVRFSSDAGLTEREILGKLGAGGSLDSFTLIQDQNRTENTLVEIFNPSSGLSLGERITGLAGFRSVEIGTGVSSVTGEVIPKARLMKPVTENLELQFNTELSAQNWTEAILEYPLTTQFKLLSGWRNISATGNPESGTGSFFFGGKMQQSFSGIYLFPEKLEITEEDLQ